VLLRRLASFSLRIAASTLAVGALACSALPAPTSAAAPLAAAPAEPATPAPAVPPPPTPAAQSPAAAKPQAAPSRRSPSARSTASTPSAELSLRLLGAIGDGQPHPVSEWIAQKKYKNLRDIQREYPFVTALDWSADEAAFQRALHDLPPEGGTIRIPAGRYIATAYGWRIDRDHVRLVGAGMRDTMLSTGPKLNTGLVLAPAPGEGWQLGADKEYPFAPDSGAFDSDKLRLREPARAAEFKAGDLVFIRGGANGFDQDYGEFNEIVGTTPEGDILLKHPLSRDYTLAALNWAGEIAEPLTLPKPGKTVTIRVRTGEGFAELPKGGVITVGEALLEIVGRSGDSVTLRNPTRSVLSPLEGAAPSAPSLRNGADGAAPSTISPTPGFNPPPGTVLPAGTKISKSRSVIKVTRTTRDFHVQGLRIFGRRNPLNLSNSYESTFTDCDFVRRPEATTPAGGLTIDADSGRFATFLRCSFRSGQAAPMRFARSFGNIAFTDCTFVATNVAFSEFCFAGTLERSRLQVPATLGRAILVGRSCGELRIEDNKIIVTGGTLTVFDATTDIPPPASGRPARLVIRHNQITGPGTLRPSVFQLQPGRPASDDISGNTLNNAPVEPLANSAP
jgi:hypothetical protein